MRKLNFLLVEDEALIREGLRSLLEKESFVRNVFEASNVVEFVAHLKSPVDIAVMDYRLPDTNGLELISMLKKDPREVKVIMLTGIEGSELILNLLKAGVHGIIHKLDGYKEIRNAIQAVSENGSYFPDRIVEVIRSNAHRWDNVPPVVLNFHEDELLSAIASGLTTKQIAIQLKMSASTAETYRIRLIRKLGVHNTAGLLAYAYRNGIL
jgi:DNA-binding NarL/FixJ family response regulator